MKVTLLIWLFGFAAFAQNIAVLTYEFANPQAVVDGCPKDWPYSIKDIGSRTNLPPELSAPWKMMTKIELEASMKSLEAAKEVYNNREHPDVTTRKQLIADIVADLRLIRSSSGPLTVAQMSNALRRISAALLILIEEGRVSLQ